MSDDNNQKSRGPRKGGGAGGRGGGGRDGGSRGGGFGRDGQRNGPPRSGGGERPPFRSRSESGDRPRPASADGGERPARRFDRPSGPRDTSERPFRARPDGERGASRPARDGERPGGRGPSEAGSGFKRPERSRDAGERTGRDTAERPYRARPDGERSSSRPPRDGDRPRGRVAGERGETAGGFKRPRPDRPERSRDGAERPHRSRTENTVADARPVPAVPQEPERIAKVMARAGVASRRDSEAMIAEGRVTVNGEVLTSPALDVGPNDTILVDGEQLPERERTRMWLYHKPRGLVTTNHDPEGRPTVFDALPEDLPRVLSVGRLDINTEGLLLLTNDGGLARMLELPQTGWLRRYRVRAFGSVTQDKLDSLRDGVTIEGISYGPVVARFEREQGSNTWLTVDLREGKNREVKTVLEHLGLVVNRLIRISFGPFQLGDLLEGEADELRSRVLKDQLGEELMAQAGVDFEAPRRDEAPPAPRHAPAGDDKPRRRRSAEAEFETRPAPARGEKPWTKGVWRDEEAAPQRERKAAPRRGADPKAERQAREETAAVSRKRAAPIADPKGRRVLVERISATSRDARAEPEQEGKRRPDRKPRSERGDGPARAPAPTGQDGAGQAGTELPRTAPPARRISPA